MAKSVAKTFTAVLEPLRNGLGWVVVRVPFDIRKTWPERRGFRVRGEIAGFAFRSALRPYAGGGHFLLVNRKMQAAAKATAGSEVRIKLEPDLEERLAVMPPELAHAMMGDRRLRKWFDGLNDYTRRVICALVSEAKSGEARERKAEQMAEWMLLALEGELDPPPILKSAFQRQPLARVGWDAMSPTRRRNHLMGIFHYQGAEARERRAAQAIEDAVAVARRAGN